MFLYLNEVAFFAELRPVEMGYGYTKFGKTDELLAIDPSRIR